MTYFRLECCILRLASNLNNFKTLILTVEAFVYVALEADYGLKWFADVFFFLSLQRTWGNANLWNTSTCLHTSS